LTVTGAPTAIAEYIPGPGRLTHYQAGRCAYDFADGDTVDLKLDKKALEALPAVKVKRK
jgi:hypothetical protein